MTYYPLRDHDNEYPGLPRVRELGCLVVQMEKRRVWFGAKPDTLSLAYPIYNGENDGGGWDACISITNSIILPA